MHPLLLLAGAGALWLAKGASSSAKLPPGQGPFDAFPVGVDGSTVLSADVFQGSSGHRYKVTGFSVADGRTYYVAQKQGDVDWLSYFLTAAGGRTMWAANADQHGEIDEMKRDFQLSAVT
jgi:hypothetical protein